MRHGKKFNHLSRTSSHRKAMLANMASSLIKHKRVSTTVAKAKALRTYVEPIITKSKDDTTHSRRIVFSQLQDKDSVKELFAVVAGKVAERPGGYTRIIKVGNRLGDNADMCIIELVDFNENLLKDTSTSSGKTRRSRRGGKSKSSDQTDTAKTESKKEAPKKEEAKKEEPKKEEAKTAAPANEEAKVEEVKTEDKKAQPEAKEEPKVEAKKESETNATDDKKSEAKDDTSEEEKKEN